MQIKSYFLEKYTNLIGQIQKRLSDKDRQWFIVSVFILNTVYPVQLMFQLYRNIGDRLSNSFCELWFSGVFAVLIAVIFHKYLLYAFSFISVILFAVDLFCYFRYNTVFDESLSDLLYNTNYGEAYEYLRQEADTGYLFYFIFFIVIGFLLLRFIKIFLLRINFSMKKYIILFFLLLIIISSFSSIVKTDNISEKVVFRINSITYYCMLFRNHFQNTVYDEINAYLDEWSEDNKDLYFSEDGNDGEPEYVIYCIGESYSSHFASAYGYSLKTTPYLDDCNNKVVFRHAVSPESYTVGALKRIGMNSVKNGSDKFYENGAIADIMKNAGWDTCWISNQNYGGNMGGIEKMLAERCDKSIFSFRGEYWQANIPHDEVLLPFIKDEALAGNKKMIFIHLMGSHFLPYERYPDNFNFFRPSDIEADSDRKREFIAQYCNSVLYNDYVMKRIADIFRAKNAVMVYLSDHGEIVFNGRDADRVGRGYEDIDPVVYDVPMIVWFSDVYKEKYADRIKELDQIKDDVFYTENVSDVIFKLAGIKIRED